MGDVAADDGVTDGSALGVGADGRDGPHGEPLAVLADADAFALVPPMDGRVRSRSGPAIVAASSGGARRCTGPPSTSSGS